VPAVHDFEGDQTYTEKPGHNFALNATFDEVGLYCDDVMTGDDDHDDGGGDGGDDGDGDDDDDDDDDDGDDAGSKVDITLCALRVRPTVRRACVCVYVYVCVCVCVCVCV
jgi:hypothetical protein